MKLTPKKIRETYNSSPPYQVKDIMKNYIDQKIHWDLKYFNITNKREGKLNITFFSDDGEVVFCDINENDFPMIKLFPRDTPIRLIGKIRDVDSLSIEIKNAQLKEIRDENGQIYFPQGSRENLLSFLEAKLLGANNIKIYDSYPDKEILKLLESTAPKAKILLLGRNPSLVFCEEIKAFNTYFDKNVIVKKTNVSHARFYIIDREVFQVDSSLKNFGGNKATMVHKIDKEAEAIKQDFDKWWDEAVTI